MHRIKSRFKITPPPEWIIPMIMGMITVLVLSQVMDRLVHGKF